MSFSFPPCRNSRPNGIQPEGILLPWLLGPQDIGLKWTLQNAINMPYVYANLGQQSTRSFGLTSSTFSAAVNVRSWSKCKNIPYAINKFRKTRLAIYVWLVTSLQFIQFQLEHFIQLDYPNVVGYKKKAFTIIECHKIQQNLGFIKFQYF
jgi:hypothetical protein